jgi:hypothetical protein
MPLSGLLARLTVAKVLQDRNSNFLTRLLKSVKRIDQINSTSRVPTMLAQTLLVEPHKG